MSKDKNDLNASVERLGTHPYQALSVCLPFSMAYLPPRRIDNAFFGRTGRTPQHILRATGIHQRRYALDTQAASDLAIRSCQPLFKHDLCLPEELSLLVVATSSGDVPSPATAHFVHHGLGLPPAMVCCDVASSCTSFLTAAMMGGSLLHSRGLGGKALILATEVKHKGTDDKDPLTAPLFADAAAGMVLMPSLTESLGFTFCQNNSEWANRICTPVGGSREPTTVENIGSNKLQIQQGKTLFAHTVHCIVKAILHAYEHLSFIRLVFVHQASARIVLAVQEQVHARFPQAKIPILLSDVGNTACASLPLLRVRVNFLRAMTRALGYRLQASYLLDDFRKLCEQKSDHFSYNMDSNSVHLCAVWGGERIFIVDDGCYALADTWLGNVMDKEECQAVLDLLWDDLMTHNAAQSVDLWVVAGGGFQVLAVAHWYS